jgi:hypothetical protein
MTWAQGQLVLSVIVMAAATMYLQAMDKGKVARTWAGLLGSVTVIMVGLVVFLSGLHDMRVYL